LGEGTSRRHSTALPPASTLPKSTLRKLWAWLTENNLKKLVFLSLLIAALIAGGWWFYVFINKVDEIDSRITVGDNLLNIGRYAEAKKAYEYALEIEPHNAEASWGQKKAAVWDIQEKPLFELAIKHLYEKDPEDEHVNLFLGEFYATSPTRDENAKAIDYLKKAIELNPKVAEAYFDLGVLYEQSGKTQEAETNYQQAVDISHSTAKYLNNLAYLYFKQKDYQKALTTYGKVSKFPLSALESAKIYWRLGKVDKAMEFQRLALEWLNDDALMLNPDQQKPWDFEFGKEEWLEQLFQTSEKKSYASLCLSVSQYLLGQTDEAAKTIANVREQKLTRQATIDQIMRKELEELALDYPTFAVQLDAYMKTYLPSKK
jgi:tetratricopeptide (TPR) repeat protein